MCNVKLDTLTFTNVSCYCSMVILIMYRSANCTVCFLEKQTQHMDLDVKLNVVTFVPDSIC